MGSVKHATAAKAKSTPARNLEGFDNDLAISIEDVVETQTIAELRDGPGGSGDIDGANPNTFRVTGNDSNERAEMEPTVTINNITGEALNRPKVHTDELKKILSVRLERIEAASKRSSMSKHEISKKSKARNAQEASSSSKVGEKRFKCTWKDCPMRFTRRSDLERHLRVHTGEKPFKCTWAHCKRRFTQKHYLIYHLRTHSGEKPFKCSSPHCGKSFTVSGSLISHRRIHTGERPYSCTLCGKSFSHSESRKSHMRIHTGEKPFKCDLCGAEYSRPTSFCYHKKTHVT